MVINISTGVRQRAKVRKDGHLDKIQRNFDFGKISISRLILSLAKVPDSEFHADALDLLSLTLINISSALRLANSEIRGTRAQAERERELLQENSRMIELERDTSPLFVA